MSKSKEKSLATKLNTLCRCLDFKYSINSGGCCFVAALIADILTYYKIKYKVIIFKINKTLYTTDKRFVRLNLKLGRDVLEGSHYAIITENNYHINFGYFTQYDTNLIVSCVKPNYLLRTYDENVWNSMYSVEHNKLLIRVFNKFKQK